jgi:hypothetical protein
VHHWVVCHEIMREDSQRVQRVTIVRYEDFVRSPDDVLATIFATVGLAPHPAGEQVRPGINDAYFKTWRTSRNPLRVLDRAIAARRFNTAVETFGYSLRQFHAGDPMGAGRR